MLEVVGLRKMPSVCSYTFFSPFFKERRSFCRCWSFLELLTHIFSPHTLGRGKSAEGVRRLHGKIRDERTKNKKREIKKKIHEKRGGRFWWKTEVHSVRRMRCFGRFLWSCRIQLSHPPSVLSTTKVRYQGHRTLLRTCW